MFDTNARRRDSHCSPVLDSDNNARLCALTSQLHHRPSLACLTPTPGAEIHIAVQSVDARAEVERALPGRCRVAVHDVEGLVRGWEESLVQSRAAGGTWHTMYHTFVVPRRGAVPIACIVT
jgi:hypothetical protein